MADVQIEAVGAFDGDAGDDGDVVAEVDFHEGIHRATADVADGAGEAVAGGEFDVGGVGGDDDASGFDQGNDGFAFFEFEVFAAVAGDGGGQLLTLH